MGKIWSLVLHGRFGPILATAGSVVGVFANWWLMILFARSPTMGGAVGVGQYALVMALATPVFAFFQLSLRNVFVSLATPYCWRSYLVLRFAGLTLASVFVLVIAMQLGYASSALVFAIVVLKCADGSLDLLYAPIQRSLNIGVFGGLLMVNGVATVLFGTAAMALTLDPVLVLWSSVIVSLAVLFGGMRFYRAALALSNAGVSSGWVEILTSGLALSSVTVLSVLTTYIPLLLLGKWSGHAIAGVFAGAMYIVMFGSLAGSSVQAVLLPKMRATADKSGRDALLRETGRVSLVAVVIGAGLVGAATFFGRDVLVIVYGSEFMVDRSVIFVLGCASVVVFVGVIISGTLAVLNRFGIQFVVMTISLVVTALCCQVLLTLGLEPLLAAALGVLMGSLVRLIGIMAACLRASIPSSLIFQESFGE